MRVYQCNPTWVLLALSITAASGCTALSPRGVPPDFMFILDARSPGEQAAQHLFIRINARGQGHFERYNTGGLTRHDEGGMVVYDSDQVVETGDFELRGEQVKQLWQAIKENNFFQLRGDYRMAIGCYYAFVMIEADGQTHQIDNAGMEVTEIRAVVEKVRSMLPAGVALRYSDCAN